MKRAAAFVGPTIVVAVVVSTSALTLIGKEAPLGDVQKGEDAAAKRIAAFEASLDGAALVGHFTVTGGKDHGKLTDERYELSSVRHLGDGQWLFEARIKYGDHDVKLPLTLPIHWAGDTPVITVDKLPVIGIGAFDARVMIYEGHYAGFWSGGSGKDKHGGHLFGVVEKD